MKHRRSIRLHGYDYTQPGAYFVTIVTHQRQCFLADVADAVVSLTKAGEIAKREWERLADRFTYILLDEMVVMPNHIHGLIQISGRESVNETRLILQGKFPINHTTERFGKPVSGSLPTIVRSYKSAVTYRLHGFNRGEAEPVWQRNYYEHVIRDDAEFRSIREYIRNNPIRWELDRENPGRGTAAN